MDETKSMGNSCRYGYDESPWNDADYYRGEYSKIAPYLNVVSGPKSS